MLGLDTDISALFLLLPPTYVCLLLTMSSRMNQWFVPGEGIAREVITADIQRYLGPDALVRPGSGTGEYEVRPSCRPQPARVRSANRLSRVAQDIG